MRKLFFVLIVISSVFTAYQANTLEKTVENIELTSLEAMAQGESGDGGSWRWHSEKCPNGNTREVCVDNGDGSSCSCGSTTRPC